jgi:signal transduction histidine kinase
MEEIDLMINQILGTDPCLLAERLFFLKESQAYLTNFVFECNRCQWEEQKQEKLIAESQALLRVVAHELKHPLSVIVSSAQLLQIGRETMSPVEKETLTKQIVRYSLKMSHIIDELLLLSSISEIKVETTPLNMADILAAAQEQLDGMIKNRQAKLVLPPVWPTAIGYAPWIERVWVNYLSNALKYGGDPPQIELGAGRQTDGMIRFWIQDNGSGLIPGEQTQLFKPFVQLSQTQDDGHGLGLSIVQRIVERLGGQVGVESKGIPGLGCTFFFTLPDASP